VELGASAAQEIWDSGSYYVWLLEMPAILPGVACCNTATLTKL
jgi:hypothetical protein